MTRLAYRTVNGKLAVQIPPATPSAGDREGSSGGAGFTSPLALAHAHLARVIESVPTVPADGEWYCEEMVH